MEDKKFLKKKNNSVQPSKIKRNKNNINTFQIRDNKKITINFIVKLNDNLSYINVISIIEKPLIITNKEIKNIIIGEDLRFNKRKNKAKKFLKI